MLSKYLFCCLVFLGTGLGLRAQEIHPADTAAALNLTELGHQWVDSANYDSSTFYYRKSAAAYLDLIEQKDDSIFWVRYLNDIIWIGENFRVQRMYDSAMVNAQKANKIGLSKFGRLNKAVARSFNLLGSVHDDIDLYDQSLAYHQESYEIRRQLFGDHHDEVSHSLNNLGNTALSKGKFEEALEYFNRSLEIRENLPEINKQDIAASHINMGLTLTQMGNFNTSFDHYFEAEELLLEVLPEKHYSLGALYNNLAISYQNAGEYDRSLAYHQKALDIRTQVFGKDNLSLTDSYLNIGTVYFYKGQFLKAEKFFRKVLDIQLLHPAKNERVIGAMYHNLGAVMRMIGDRKAAREYQEKGFEMELNIYGEVHPQVAQGYLNMSLLAREFGDYGQARNHLLKALDIQMQTLESPHPDLVLTYNNLGTIEEEQGDFEKAAEYVGKAWELMLQLYGPEHPTIADAYNNRGVIALRQGKPDQAKTYFRQGLQIRKKVYGGPHYTIAQSYFNLGKIYADEGKRDSAHQVYEKALSIYRDVYGEKHPEVGITYKQLAMLAFKDDKLEPALTYLDKGLVSLGIDPSANQLSNDPSFFSQIQSETKALELLQYKSYCLLNSGEDNPDNLFRADSTLKIAHAIIDFLHKSFQYEETELYLQKLGIPLYELSIRDNLELFEHTQEEAYLNQAFSYMEGGKAVLLQRAVALDRTQKIAGIPDSLLQNEHELRLTHSYFQQQLKATQVEEGQDSLYNSLVRKVLDTQQKHDSLLSIFSAQYPDYYELKYQKNAVSLKELQTYLGKFPQTILVEFFWGGDQCIALAVSPEKVAYHSTPIDTTFINQLVEMEFILSEPAYHEDETLFKSSKKRYAEIGYDLYMKLCDTLLQQFPSYDNLIIIPDGRLGYLPFEVLLTQKPGKELSYKEFDFLLKEYTISYEYSSYLLKNSPKSVSKKYSYAGFAPAYPNPDNLFASSREQELYGDRKNQLISLRFNQPEVRQIAQLMSGIPYIGAEATESRFKEEVHKYSVIHLAMHGFIHNEEPLSSGLAFSRQNDTLNDGFLYAHELYNMKMPINLAVLSACNTGAGYLAFGEGIMSLSRAFKYAGCPNIVASYWQANDKSTQDLMTRFFQSVKQGSITSDALREAKLSFLAQANEIQAHPTNWAAWVLIGNPDSLRASTSIPSWTWIALVLFTIALGSYIFVRNQPKKDTFG